MSKENDLFLSTRVNLKKIDKGPSNEDLRLRQGRQLLEPKTFTFTCPSYRYSEPSFRGPIRNIISFNKRTPKS